MTEAEVNDLLTRVGTAIAASAKADGTDRAVRAARAAVSQLPADQLENARGIFVFVAGPDSLTLQEVDVAVGVVQRVTGPDGEILYRKSRGEMPARAVKVTIIACHLE